MLVLSRSTGEGITSRVHPSINPATPVGKLLGDEGNQVLVTQLRGNQVRLRIDAPFEFQLVRDELLVSEKA
jgi:sRNA-binding carbon storage regulator CsrA